MPLFGPWLESSIHLAGVVHLRLFFWWVDLQLLAWHLSSSSSTSGEGGLRQHQVPTMVVAAHHKQIPILCHAGVDGRAPVATILLLTTALCGYASWENPGTVANLAIAARWIVTTSEEGGRPHHQSCHLAVAFLCSCTTVRYIPQ